MVKVPATPISRRGLLLASAAALSCARKKATGYPGYCFVANQKSRSISVVDLNRFRMRKEIALEAAPGTLLARPDADSPRVIALAPETGALYDIDVASLTVSRKTWAGNQPAGMRLGPDNEMLWILCREPAALVELPLRAFRPARRIALPAIPDGFDLTSDGRAAVASHKGKSIVIISLGGAVERTIATGVEPSLIQFRADGKQILAASAPDRSLSIFDLATGRTVVRLPLPLAPRNLCMSPDGGQLFITGDGMDAVVIAYPYQTEIDQTALAGHAPGAMAVAPTTSPAYLLVANPDSNSITALDYDMRTLVAVAQVGRRPTQILTTPDDQYALAVDSASGDLAVIRLSKFAEASIRRFKAAPLFALIPVGENPVSAAVVGFRG